MKGFFGLGQLSASEKSDILNQHKSIYNGYQTMQPQVSNTQPLTVYDFAGDKEGMVVNNKGEVKRYTNVGINEQHEMKEEKEMCSECGVGYLEEGVCNECGYGNVEENWTNDTEMCECGGEMYEGVCNECGYKMNEQDFDDDFDDLDDEEEIDDIEIDSFRKPEKKEFRPGVDLGKSFEKMKFLNKLKKHDDEEMFEETGHLDDIYDEEDLNPSAGFDYIEGSSNDKDTFEGMHKKLYEQGGNANDMDVSDVDSAYDFVSNGPMNSGINPISEDDFDDLLDADEDLEVKRDELDEKEYEEMESAWNEEIDEIDVSGVQGVYGDMKPPYDFDSGGPGKAGPYQTRESEFSEGMAYVIGSEGKPRGMKAGEKFSAFSPEDFDDDYDDDYDEDELDVDFDEFDPRDKSWEEITAYTGDDEFGHVDEDIRESVISQKNKVMEMMTRMKVIK